LGSILSQGGDRSQSRRLVRGHAPPGDRGRRHAGPI